MNLQRREEIRSLANYPSEWDGAKEYQGAMRELLAHIDTLEQTAAERVIADGGRGPTPDYTGEGSAWVPPKVEAPAVVVREHDGSASGLVNIRSWIGAVGPVGAMAWVDPWEAIKVAGVRTIPADRVLGDGMVAVDREEWDRLAKSFDEDGSYFTENHDGDGVRAWACKLCERQTPGAYHQKPSVIDMKHFENCSVAILSTLRANQGGDAT